MPKNKDLKRLVRARMKKTGESYTAARAQLTKTEPTRDWPTLAGQSDATMKTKTGKTWPEWVAHLDALGAAKQTHTEIARHAYEVPGVSGWWAQSVAVGYERIRGLRARNQQRDGEFQAAKSRTFDVPVGTLYAAFTQKPKRARWLPGVDLTIRTKIKNKSLRITWPDRTSVEVYFTKKTPKKTNLAITHRKLTTRDAVSEAKASWTARLAALAAILEAPR